MGEGGVGPGEGRGGVGGGDRFFCIWYNVVTGGLGGIISFLCSWVLGLV